MSAAASPGRTWRIFAAERRVPVLARALDAALLHGVGAITRLSGMGGAPASAVLAYAGGQGYSGCESGAEHSGHWRMDCAVHPISVTPSSSIPVRRYLSSQGFAGT